MSRGLGDVYKRQPYVAAARGMVDDVIDPRDTRHALINALSMSATKRESRPAKKHGNIPL